MSHYRKLHVCYSKAVLYQISMSVVVFIHYYRFDSNSELFSEQDSTLGQKLRFSLNIRCCYTVVK